MTHLRHADVLPLQDVSFDVRQHEVGRLSPDLVFRDMNRGPAEDREGRHHHRAGSSAVHADHGRVWNAPLERKMGPAERASP